MKALPLPPQSYLEEAFIYDATTGKLYWKARPVSHFRDGQRSAEQNAASWNAQFAGTEALTSKTDQGYRKGALNRRQILAHRVIWKLVHGADPDLVDHIDGDKSNNRLVNLRDVSPAENCRNRTLPTSNSSGTIGVCWSEAEGAWLAYVRVHLGYFDRLEDAVAARADASQRFSYHPYHGRRGCREDADNVLLPALGGAR